MWGCGGGRVRLNSSLQFCCIISNAFSSLYTFRCMVETEHRNFSICYWLSFLSFHYLFPSSSSFLPSIFLFLAPSSAFFFHDSCIKYLNFHEEKKKRHTNVSENTKPFIKFTDVLGKIIPILSPLKFLYENSKIILIFCLIETQRGGSQRRKDFKNFVLLRTDMSQGFQSFSANSLIIHKKRYIFFVVEVYFRYPKWRFGSY